MDSNLRWAGIDTSTRTYSICVVDGAGGVVSETAVLADVCAAHSFLCAHQPIAEVALETGTTSIHLARALTGLQHPVALYDALKVHRFLKVKLNKTDKNDARGLAQFSRIGAGDIQKVYFRPLDLSVLRSKLVIRERLLRMRKVNEGSLMSLLHTFGVRAQESISSQLSLKRVIEGMLIQVERTYDAPVRSMVTPLLMLSLFLRAEELRIENELKVYAKNDDLCRRLMEIPGVGVISAVSFITAIGDPRRFKRLTDVGAYLGLCPKTWQTGNFSRRRGISKHGSKLTRNHLHIAARGILNSKIETSLQAWGKQLQERTNRRKAIVAVARKLAVVMLTVWKNDEHFDALHQKPQAQTCS